MKIGKNCPACQPIGSTTAALLVAWPLTFLGPLLLALALREAIKPVVAGWVLRQGINAAAAEDIQFHLATSVSWMLATMLLAPFIGLLSAAVSRPLGMWRLVVPVVVLVAQALIGFYVTETVTRPPEGDQAARVGLMIAATNQHLVQISMLLAIPPAVVGAWLGTKLWPKQ